MNNELITTADADSDIHNNEGGSPSNINDESGNTNGNSNADKAKELEVAKKLISATIRNWAGVTIELKDFTEQQKSGLRLAVTCFKGYVSGVLTFKSAIEENKYTNSKEIIEQIATYKDDLKFTYSFGGKLASHVKDVLSLLRELDSKVGGLNVNELEKEIVSFEDTAKKKIVRDTKDFLGINDESKSKENLRPALNVYKGGDLDAQLEDAKKQLADFEKEVNSAIEFLKNIETFDSKTVFSDETLNAAAFAKIFDKELYSNFTRDLKNFGDKHRDEKVMVNDWKAAVKDRAESIEIRHNELNAKITYIKGAVETENFIADNPDLKNINIPDGYSISSIGGVTKIVGDKGNTLQVCYYPVVIAAKNKNLEEKTVKLVLRYWTRNDKIKSLPPFAASILFNARKIVDLADYDFSVSTENAFLLAGYLQAFKDKNDSSIPVTYTVPHCGWYYLNDSDVFVDPRRKIVFRDDDKKDSPLVVDTDRKSADESKFADSLTTRGTLEQWKKAYFLAYNAPVARLVVAASVAAPLLKILGKRNFLIYIKAKTRAGKTTALYLGASAVGNEKLIRSFDATKIGLLNAAADVSDYPFLVDEKQVADSRLREQFNLLVYALANGIGRTKSTRDSKTRKAANWRTIAVLTGETSLIDDNADGGVFTRLISIKAPQIILDKNACKEIRDIIKENYGNVFPLILDKIFEYGKDFLRKQFELIQETFAKKHSEILDEYREYVSVLVLADWLLNISIGADGKIEGDVPHEDIALDNALSFARDIFKLIPTAAEIDDCQRESDFIFGFIAQNQSRFIGGNVELEKMQKIFGRIETDCIYITVAAMKLACSEGGFNYEKVVTDLIGGGVIVPSNKIEKGRKELSITFVKKLASSSDRCYKLFKPTTDD